MKYVNRTELNQYLNPPVNFLIVKTKSIFVNLEAQADKSLREVLTKPNHCPEKLWAKNTRRLRINAHILH